VYNLHSLKKDHAFALNVMEDIVAKTETEKRAMTALEERDFEKARRQVDLLTAQINECQATWRAAGINVGGSGFNPAQFASGFAGAQSATGPFSSFAEQIGAVIQAGKHGQRTDERLFEVRAASGLNEAIGSEGGFVVQNDFAASILSHVYTVGEIARRCTRIPITTNASGIKIPRIDEQSRADGSRWGGVRGYWTAEAGAIQTSKPAFGLLELNLKKVAAAVYCTDELVEDSAALSAFLSMVVPQELTYKVEDAIVNGDGAGKPQGLTVSPACITVSKITGQAKDSFNFENATAMWARYGGTEAGACWLIHRSVIPQLYGMAIVGGVSMWPAFTPTPAAAAPPSTLFGKPIIVAEYCQKLGDKSDVVLADLSQYVLIEKGGVQAASSIHVRFLEAEQVLRFLYRVDGQSAWATAITPKNGTDSLSPWVVLAERA
jgi:HK97 family phage major capsid protein